MKRTHLPLNGLRVLDAAARHLSFTRAADELAVTPAAVGQQIRALEDTLGVVLFRRTTRGLELTPEGEAGLEALRGGFLQFEEAVRAMQAGQSSKSLTVAAPRDLTEKWLMPRLAAIAAADPDLRFVLIAADGHAPIDFTEANLDLALRWAEGPGEHEGEALESDGMVTIAAPGTASDATIAWPGMAGDGAASVRVDDAGLAIARTSTSILTLPRRVCSSSS
ncbi:LysR family transcriptional regulator, partial [Sphingomonas bacterium]|uniref:LysR family transcriptional regulator n=1 Tax=Sphingomonas bacterium TaxID=1895847 RepID=UPI001575C352